MNSEVGLFGLALALFVATFSGIALYYHRRTKRSSGQTLEELLERLEAIDRDRISLIAEDQTIAVEQIGTRPESSWTPSDVWDVIGGLHGLMILERNCDVLIELACYVQHWYPEALVVAEELRLSAREIKWCIGRLKGASRVGHLESSIPEYAPRAVIAYYSMTRLVLSLFEATNIPGTATVQQIL